MKPKKICVTINENLHEELKKLAQKNNISVNALIRIALSGYLETNK